MSYIWLFFLSASLACGVLTGHVSHFSVAAMQGAQQGVTLCLSLAGALCLWSGVARVMEESGLGEKLSHLFSPFLSRIFPKTCRDAQARSCLCANFTANLLGLGNAATPLGLKAASRMAKGTGGVASDELCLLVVLNTASIQLIPATVASLRAAAGCETPFDILPAVWLTSLLALAAGLGMAALLRRLPCFREGRP